MFWYLRAIKIESPLAIQMLLASNLVPCHGTKETLIMRLETIVLSVVIKKQTENNLMPHVIQTVYIQYCYNRCQRRKEKFIALSNILFQTFQQKIFCLHRKVLWNWWMRLCSPYMKESSNLEKHVRPT